MAKRLTAKLVCDALQMALWRGKMPAGIIVHSDRGSQYCSADYQRLLHSHGLVCSMRKNGYCYDNAAMESSNHCYKIDAIHGDRLTTRDKAKTHTYDYIEVYYNRRRRASRLDCLSREAFEELTAA